jgi:hypothetical protein
MSADPAAPTVVNLAEKLRLIGEHWSPLPPRS